MLQSIAMTTVVVRDYDEAIAYYTQQLGLVLLEDTDRGCGKRWVRVAAPGTTSLCLLLAQASTPGQTARIGDQTGGRVSLFLHTDDFDADYAAMKSRGVTFCGPPRAEDYGKVVVFEDIYGNRWDLLELAR